MSKDTTFSQFKVVQNSDDPMYLVGYMYKDGANLQVRVPFPSVNDVAGASTKAEAAAAMAVEKAGVATAGAAVTQQNVITTTQNAADAQQAASEAVGVLEDAVKKPELASVEGAKKVGLAATFSNFNKIFGRA